MITTTSLDGTTLAIDITGTGPALIIAAGAFCDRQSKKGLAALSSGRTSAGLIGGNASGPS